MPARSSQLSFFKKTKSDYGGELMKKRAGRIGPRPLDTRNTMHLVLRSSKARGERSFLRYRKSIQDVFKRFGDRYGVRILNLANVGNHLHLQIKISNRYLYAPFIRAVTAAIAMKVTGSSRWTRTEGRFWDCRPWTRIVKSYRALLNLRDYIAINRMEGQGHDRAEARWFITGKFAWDMRGPP